MDDIEMTQFGDVYSGNREDVVLSPSGDKVLIHTTRASLQDGRLHDQLRVYDIQGLRTFVNASDMHVPPLPLWVLDQSTAEAGNGQPLITRLRWLKDESGIAFLLYSSRHRRLYLARLDSREVLPLSPDQVEVLSFEVQDRSHYVFTVASAKRNGNSKSEADAAFRVGTGRSIYELMFPARTAEVVGRGELWAAYGGPPAPVVDPSTGQAISLYEDGGIALSLAPDGAKIVSIRPVVEVPKDWETSFPAPFPNDAYRLRAGSQDLNAPTGWAYVGEYVRIDLITGKVTPLTNAPVALRAGWWEGNERPSWSDDGSRVLLPGTFSSKELGADRRPCFFVVQIASGTTECVRPLKRNLASGFEAGYETVDQSSFVKGRNDQIVLEHNREDGRPAIMLYTRSGSGAWHSDGTNIERETNTLAVTVRATFKDPPVLVAADALTGNTRTIFDPNPQLQGIALGQPEIFGWSDGSGKEWNGILYKPVGYRLGTRYPLVIQNHGYSVDRFTPSGGFPSAFVAEELASAGIMVLQVRDCDGRSTQSEGPCNVGEYEAAVTTLTREGLVDSSRLGIIGFSRTVFYVLEALTTSKLRFRAASITDGITGGYMNYLCAVSPNQLYNRDAEAIIGSPPFGPGLASWMKASPDFNLDKETTPLRVVALGDPGLLWMWEPYAALESMHKPVDLVVLNSDEHVLTDPRIRLAAQGGNLDWFRFWLQDYADRDPGKMDQYARWRKLRELRPNGPSPREGQSDLENDR
jgi:dipeptidyl aminopeptidase/acylaminoacyl peptidase